MSGSRLPADRSSEERSAGEAGERRIGLLRLNPTSLTIAFALTVVAGIAAYLVNMPLAVPELLFALVLCYVLVHGGRWAWARRRSQGVVSKHTPPGKRQRLPADSSSEEHSPEEPEDRGIGLLQPDPKSLSIAFVLTVLAGIYAYLVNLSLQVPELLFVLAACYVLVHVIRWVLARIKGDRE